MRQNHANAKINLELLSKQTEMALKISSYAHFMCFGIFLILKFALYFEGPMPYFLLIYFIISFSNNLLYRKHQKIVIVSIVFFASSFIATLLVSVYSGGLKSPFLGVIIVATMGSFISSLKHGRFFLGFGIVGFLLIFLNDIYKWIPSQEYTQFQQLCFTLITYTFIFIISGAAGLIIARTSFRGYQAKKEVEKQSLIIEESKKEIELQKEESDRLLLNILPSSVAEELKSTGKASTKSYENVTILFSDFKGFTSLVSTISAVKLVEELNDIFGRFDDIMEAHRVEKIETIGDAYMAACGLPEENPNHAINCIDAAREMLDFLKIRNENNEIKWQMRVGIHSGPVVAGVVGKKKFAYDLFGDTVNTASRIETNGEPGKINISKSTYRFVKDYYQCVPRGQIPAKGKGKLDMYFVE